jgi:hypothetical protein
MSPAFATTVDGKGKPGSAQVQDGKKKDGKKKKGTKKKAGKKKARKGLKKIKPTV